MIGTTILGGYDKKTALIYLESLERYLGELKMANFRKTNGLSFSRPVRDRSVEYPRRARFFGYEKGDFEKTVSRLEIRISLEESQLALENEQSVL